MLLPRRTFALLVIGLLLAACGGPDPTPSGLASPTPLSPTSPTATASPAPSGESSETPPPTPTPRPIAADPPPIALQPVAGGLVEPVSIAGSPDGWLIVNERAGRVIAVDPATGTAEVALDLRDRVLGQGEQGLLGLALHPAWPEDPRAFVHYSDRNGNTVLAEFEGSDATPIVIDPATERVLLRVEQPFTNHNGGQLAFGPDGYLWLGLGDGGSGGDPLGNGQDPSTLLGTILRLDVARPGGYAVPSDNPFANGGGAPEVYLYGLRNPWRFSFDRVTGELWIADVGQNAFEEINRLDPMADAGANLGWPIMEATHCFTDAACSSEGLVLPIAEYGHDSGCSVTGGHVYRGDAIAALTGWYLFADYCSGLLFGLASDAEGPADGSARSPRVLLDTDALVASFGEAADGELYLADLGSGTIYRIVGGD